MHASWRQVLITGVIVISFSITVVVYTSIGTVRRRQTNRDRPRLTTTNTSTLAPPAKGATNNTSCVVESAYRRGGFWNMSLMKAMETPRPLFDFLLTPWSITCDERAVSSSQGGPRWSMIVGVKSTSKNFERRNRVRQTWGSYKLFHGVQLQVIFVVGNAPNPDSELKLLEENRKNGDILQIDRKEVYGEIGLKALAVMQWIARHCPSHWLYSSADDDMVPNLLALYKHIEKLASDRPGVSLHKSLKALPIVCGYDLRTDGFVQRKTEKNMVSFELYSLRKYPVFCAGGFYTMPVRFAIAIFRKSRYHEYFYVDDVWLTGLLRLAVVDSSEFACSNVADDYCAMSRIHVNVVKHAKKDATFSSLWHDMNMKMNEI